MTESQPALTATGLGKTYGRSWGLRDCSFQLPRGRIAALVGPNGAGKSTLLRMAAGITRPSQGSITVFGQSPQQQTKEVLSRIGYLDQERPLYRSFRVEEMLRVGRSLNPRWDDQIAHTYLADLGIGLGARIGSLSLGQQAQVALTLCLAKRPDLLLLDEPVAALDPLARSQLMGVLLRSVADDAATVVLSSHVISELEAVCDYIIILCRSRVAIADDLEHLLATHHLLIGGGGETPGEPEGPVTVVYKTATARQSSWLVRADVPIVSSTYQVVEPTLEEIVLAYLHRQSEMDELAVRGRVETP
jgi:ABC-2 type transport system ATP-binding protein